MSLALPDYSEMLADSARLRQEIREYFINYNERRKQWEMRHATINSAVLPVE